ncbi:hypothetical protein NUW58_g7295 [Xylaria curta]|uniref:Uncharacterized protein n=1 Tax=Xylaria curta TaxID=42375 RepID=A0ACC1NJ48_9PEZI|nr:hypothetical protein NUW58_g7295 [Xylaria curta]
MLRHKARGTRFFISPCAFSLLALWCELSWIWINWEKLAAKAGFKDGATARAHYGTLLQPDDSNGPSKRGRLEAAVAKEADVKTEDGARGQFTSHYLYGLEEGEI